MKKVVNLQRKGSLYTVKSTTNTLEPRVGDNLTTQDVEDLLLKASIPATDLTVNIKAP